jgi:hypothetical protein
MKTNLENKVSKAGKKEDASDCWTHIILEADCARRIFDFKKSKYCYTISSLKTGTREKIPNPFYEPNTRTPKKPEFCPGMPQYICLTKKCPHLGYTNADEKDYRQFYKACKNKK